jgi:hypothetical protein
VAKVIKKDQKKIIYFVYLIMTTFMLLAALHIAKYITYASVTLTMSICYYLFNQKCLSKLAN